MLLLTIFRECTGIACWVSRYGLYSTLHFASGYVANRRNRISYYSSSRLASHKMKLVLQAVQLRNPG